MFAKILVVDDEPSIVDVLTRFLSREGYEVVTAANGLQALERVTGLLQICTGKRHSV